MERPPPELDGARVLAYASLSAAPPTGLTRHHTDHYVNDEFRALAIARYDGDTEHYLFYCDEQWSVLTDTCHESRAAAERQARWEFEDVTFTDVP